MLKIRTGNDSVSEQTRKLIRGGCYGDSGGKREKEIDLDGNSPPKLLRARTQDVMRVIDRWHEMVKLSINIV